MSLPCKCFRPEMTWLLRSRGRIPARPHSPLPPPTMPFCCRDDEGNPGCRTDVCETQPKNELGERETDRQTDRQTGMEREPERERVPKQTTTVPHGFMCFIYLCVFFFVQELFLFISCFGNSIATFGKGLCCGLFRALLY